MYIQISVSVVDPVYSKMNIPQDILKNDIASNLLHQFLEDCYSGHMKLSTNLHSLKEIERSWIESADGCNPHYLQNTKAGLLIFKFLATKITYIDDKNLLRLLQILQLTDSTDKLLVCSSKEFQNFKDQLRQFRYTEPEPYSAAAPDEEDLEEPHTPIDGLPNTSKVLFVPDLYMGQDLHINKLNVVTTGCKPTLKINTDAFVGNSHSLQNYSNSPIVVLDTSFLSET